MLRLITGPAAEPVAVSEAKDWAKIDETADDTLLGSLVPALREHLEQQFGLACINQLWEWRLDRFPDATYRRPFAELLLPKVPLLKVVSVTYVDLNGVTQTLASSAYVVDTAQVPGLLYPIYGTIWPSTQATPQAVTVRFRAGYATPISVNIGTEFITALGHAFAENDPIQFQNTGGALPGALSAGVVYYAKGVSGDTFQVSLTPGGAAVDLTSAGSGTSFAGIVPEPIRQAIKLAVATAYLQREDQTPDQLQPASFTAQRLLANYRLYGVLPC